MSLNDRKKAGVPGENSCMHGEDMNTPYRKAPDRIETTKLLAVR